MFRNLLRPDSPLMITMTQLTDCIFLSLFFLVGCMPVLTAGASFAALYDASFRAFRQGEKHSWQRFFAVYKANWKQSILLTFFCGGCFRLVLKCMIRLWNSAVAGQGSWMVFSGAALIAMVVLGWLCLVFPMLSRFENDTIGLLKNAALLAMAKLPLTLCLGILNAVTIYACLRWVFPLFFLPSLTALLGSLFIEPMFKPYMGTDT